jgi:hypothetical protein
VNKAAEESEQGATEHEWRNEVIRNVLGPGWQLRRRTLLIATGRITSALEQADR